jgi:hypothetical protein
MTAHFQRKSQGAGRNGAIPASIFAGFAKDATQDEVGWGQVVFNDFRYLAFVQSNDR